MVGIVKTATEANLLRKSRLFKFLSSFKSGFCIARPFSTISSMNISYSKGKFKVSTAGTLKIFLNLPIMPVTLSILLSVLVAGCEDKIVIKDDLTPPVVLQAPQVLPVDTCALVFWETDEPCSAAVEYFINNNSNIIRTVTPEFRQHQEVWLHKLEPNTEYAFTTTSYDAYGNSTTTALQTFRTGIDTGAILTTGWQAYTEHRYLFALQQFELYRQYRPNDLRGYLGVGWAQVRLDSLISQGIVTLNNLLIQDSHYLDARAGIILGYYLLNNWLMVQYEAEQFLAELSSASLEEYAFRYDTLISSYGIRLMLAEAYINSQNYSAADSLLDILEPNNNLSTTDTSTWIVGDNNFYYESYTEALEGWILYLQWLYWENGLPKKSTAITLLRRSRWSIPH